MKIAFVLPYLADHYGGPVTVVRNVGRVLAGRGHTVSYWATADEEDQIGPWSNDGEVHVFARDWPRRWFHSSEFGRNLSAAIASVDIVHVQGVWLYPSLAGCRAALAHKVPYILAPAGCLAPWSLRGRRFKYLKKMAYLQLLGKPVMRRAVCLQAASALEAEYFTRLGHRGPITIIPNGVDTEELSAGGGEEADECWPVLKNRLVVLFMSRLSPEKGLDLLIPLWANLCKSNVHKDPMLVIAGPSDHGYQGAVERMIEKYKLRSHVMITGMMRGRRKAALLRRADVFVLPSYTENFGIVVAEALACGVPVVTTTGTPWQQLERVARGAAWRRNNPSWAKVSGNC